MTREEVLAAACRQNGISYEGYERIGAGTNAAYRLPSGIVARICQLGSPETSRAELDVAIWLRQKGIPVMQAFTGIVQPVRVGLSTVTFWHELKRTRETLLKDVASVLRQLHRIKPPPGLVSFDPFKGIEERISVSAMGEPTDLWLRAQHLELCRRYVALTPALTHVVIHGDATPNNVIVTSAGPTLVDLDGCSLGPHHWDLICAATEHFSYNGGNPATWEEFVDSYGFDITTWPGYGVLRGIREFRRATFAVAAAALNPKALVEARHRIDCLQGKAGPRPWTWTAIDA